ncbi:MAG TPA: class I SAM-dependent methyltransferase [Candidatus Limnocylindria bacterium]|nr:class I SAM-dependent methyltransferase [Candidatus Limnocylindria bacterium]
MSIRTLGPVDPELASWNDRMYEAHPTPYGGGIAGRIEAARVRAVLDLAAIGPGDRVLEVGCESGRLLAAVPPCRRLVGVDISRRALEDARARLGPRDVELFQVDALRGLPFDRGAFDVILCSEMLEHVSEPGRVVANIHAVCAPTTRVVVSVPIEAPKVLVKTVLARLGLLERLFPGIEPAQSEWHVHAFSPAMLRRVVTERFTIERTRRVIAAHEVALLRAR